LIKTVNDFLLFAVVARLKVNEIEQRTMPSDFRLILITFLITTMKGDQYREDQNNNIRKQLTQIDLDQ
jgi:hypothetical protein